MDFSRTNEGYTSCGPVVEMSWHRAGVLLLGAQSCLPVPGVPAVGGIGNDRAIPCVRRVTAPGLTQGQAVI
uniref:Uncharacterized protein n=1 Tax=Oryza rufipogon TaxID=4529 RepID=A0A679BBA5_ORYRU|nr:hypothetical protein [Oryza rufipogon]